MFAVALSSPPASWTAEYKPWTARGNTAQVASGPPSDGYDEPQKGDVQTRGILPGPIDTSQLTA